MKLCVASALAVLASGQFALDHAKLTNFTAKTTIQINDFPEGSLASVNETSKSTMKLDLYNEKMSFQATATGSWKEMKQSTGYQYGPPHPMWLRMFPTGSFQASANIEIDATSGTAKIAEKVKVEPSPGDAQLDFKYCVHVKLPATFTTLLPPKTQLKSVVDAKLQAAQTSLNNAVAQGILVKDSNGDYVAKQENSYAASNHYPHPKYVAKLAADGTPVAAGASYVCDAQCVSNYGVNGELPEQYKVSLKVKVSEFTAGAGEISSTPCVSTSVEELSEHPETAHATRLFDMHMANFAAMPEVNLKGLELPTFNDAELLDVLKDDSVLDFVSDFVSVQDDGVDGRILMTAVLAGVAGMIGGALVLAWTKSGRKSEPLLEEA